MVTVDQVTTHPDWVIVDLRPPSPFNQIPGSLILPLNQLKRKSWLKQKTVVLVGSGLDRCESERDQLVQVGFLQVMVLEHGAMGWYFGGKPMLGRRWDHVCVVTADQVLHRNADTRLWLRVLRPLPGSEFLGLDPHGLGLTQALARLLDGTPPGQVIVLLDDSGEMRDELLQTLVAQRSPRVFLLEGGKTALRSAGSHQPVGAQTHSETLSALPGQRTVSPKKPCNCPAKQ
jgi:rhodanese-related sulfurtransferase